MGWRDRLPGGQKVLGGVGIEQKKEVLESRIAAKFGEQSAVRLNPQYAEQLLIDTKNGAAQIKNFEQEARRVVINKKQIAFEIDNLIKQFRNLLATEHIFPTAGEIAAEPQVANKLLVEMERAVIQIVNKSREYSVLVKIFTNIVMHECQKLPHEIIIDERTLRSPIVGRERNLSAELNTLLTELERLNLECSDYHKTIDESQLSAQLQNGALNIRALHMLMFYYAKIFKVEEDISKLAVKIVKSGNPELMKAEQEVKALRGVRSGIQNWSEQFNIARIHSYMTFHNLVSVSMLVGMFCSFGLLGAAYGPIKQVLDAGEKYFFGREFTLLEYASDIFLAGE
ncbi:MAG: hypothetical protein HY438_01555 [DPANN group archaeon]|nr:hypothetical protein [DPANN group archaeon]